MAWFCNCTLSYFEEEGIKMQRIHRVFLATVLFLVAVPVVRLVAFRIPVEGVTVMEQVSPEEATPGEVARVTGYGLDAANVRQVYLIYGQAEYRLEILKQSSTALTFRVPVEVPPGVMRLAVMVTGRAELVEQPVVLRVLEGMMTERRHTPAR
jgi:hypothetical protein